MGTPAQQPEPKACGSHWPFVLLFFFMWGGMIGTTLNTDPVKLEFNVPVIGGGLVVAGLVFLLIRSRWRGFQLFDFEHHSVIGNLGWHALILTGILFLSYLFFDVLVQVLALKAGVPIFAADCAVSQRDTALFVWDAMAKGAFKFLASYLHLPTEACPPNTASSSAWLTEQAIRWFTALVVVWYAVSFFKAWVSWLKRPRAGST